MSAAALIFSATVLQRRLFGCGALLSAALIFSATILLWRLFEIFPYLVAFVALQIIKLSPSKIFDKKQQTAKKKPLDVSLGIVIM